MEEIASFRVDHLKLNRGIYVSRRDCVGNETLTSFDIRMKLPHREPVLGSTKAHAIEHLATTWLRNNPEWKDKIVYWGPMGCITGNYLIIAGNYSIEDVAPLITQLFEYIVDFEGEILGASALERGNLYNNNLPIAKCEVKKYLEETLYKLTARNLHYPES